MSRRCNHYAVVMVQRLVGAEEMREEANYNHAVFQSFFLDGLNAVQHLYSILRRVQRTSKKVWLNLFWRKKRIFFATSKFPNATPYFQLRKFRCGAKEILVILNSLMPKELRESS